jgi:hypothetical protein
MGIPPKMKMYVRKKKNAKITNQRECYSEENLEYEKKSLAIKCQLSFSSFQ